MKVLMVEPTVYEGGALVRQPTRPARLTSLTLPYLAAYVPEADEVALAFEMHEDLFKDYDLASYDVVAFTAQTVQVKRTIELLHELRGTGPKLVVGGAATVEDDGRLVRALGRVADAVAVGDGELVWPQILEDARAGALQETYRSRTPTPISGWPLPRFDLVNFDHIDAPHVLPSLTARGCPRRCTFCSEFLFSKWVLRPVAEVVTELLRYRDHYGVPRICFWDDDFLVHPQRSKELLSQLVGEGIEWACQTDFNLARHPDLVDLAIAAGMRTVSFGVESVRESNRDWLEKTFFTIPEAEELLLKLHEAGVETGVNVIFGFDHDDADVFDETYEFLVRTKASRFHPSILYPIAGTPLHAILEREGRLLNTPVPGPKNDLDVWFQPKHLTAEQLVEGYLAAERRFDELPDGERKYWLGRDRVVV